MKLFWVTPECPYPPNTGGRVGIWKRIFHMSNKNDIFLYSICDNELDYKYEKYINKYCVETKLYKRCNKLKSLLTSIVLPFPAVSRWNKWLQIDLEEDFDIIQPDLVIIDFPQMIGILPLNIRVSGKIILNQHNIEFLTLRSLSNNTSLIKGIVYFIVSKQMELYEKIVYKKTSIKLYTFVSDKDKEYFEKRYGLTNTLLVPVGAELYQRQEIKENCHNLVFVAKMSYPANEVGALWLINKIFPLIKKKVSDAQLYLVGKEPQESLYDASKNNADIIITGVVDSLTEYYDRCNVVVVPIMTGGGVNVKLLEALGYGKYVVTTSKGIEGTKFKDSIHVKVADTVEDFANTCIELLLNPFSNRNIKMKEEAMRLMYENYSWEGIVKNYEKVLQDISGI